MQISRLDGGDRHDPDVPRKAGFIGHLHVLFGRAAINTASRLRRPVSLGVRLLALNAQNEILLVRHTYMPGLTLPGGGVEPGETTRGAAEREAQEEAGLQITDRPELFHVYLNRNLGDRDHVVLYVTRNALRPRDPGRSAEIISSQFYKIDALPDDVTPATRARIAEVLHGADLSDTW